MPDYAQGKIYAIKSYQTDKVYIGSTTQRLSKRLNDHKDGYKRWKDGKNNYMTSFEIIEYDDCYIQLIKNVSCNNKEELTSVEYDVIQETENSVNKANPKCKAPDYSNAKIYKIVSDKTNEVYIGSTTQQLSKRLIGHKSHYKLWKDKKRNYISSFEILQYDDARIELIEEYECKTEEELYKREGQIIKEYDNRVNKMIAGRTDTQWREDNKERLKQWREDHKEEIYRKAKEWRERNKDHLIIYNKERRERNKEHDSIIAREWRERNKDHLKNYRKHYDKSRSKKTMERNKKSYRCICGKNYTYGHKARHIRSVYHQTHISSV